MRALVFLLKLLLKILVAPVILALTLFVWICVGIVYISGLVLGLISMVIALLGVAVLITYSLQNGIILLVMAFLISPFGLPMAAGQGAGFEVCHSGFGLWIKYVTDVILLSLKNRIYYIRIYSAAKCG